MEETKIEKKAVVHRSVKILVVLDFLIFVHWNICWPIYSTLNSCGKAGYPAYDGETELESLAPMDNNPSTYDGDHSGMPRIINYTMDEMSTIFTVGIFGLILITAFSIVQFCLNSRLFRIAGEENKTFVYTIWVACRYLLFTLSQTVEFWKPFGKTLPSTSNSCFWWTGIIYTFVSNFVYSCTSLQFGPSLQSIDCDSLGPKLFMCYSMYLLASGSYVLSKLYQKSRQQAKPFIYTLFPNRNPALNNKAEIQTKDDTVNLKTDF